MRARRYRYLPGLIAAFALAAGSADLGAKDKAGKADTVLARVEADLSLPRDPRIAKLPAAQRREMWCVALNIYHEARGSILSDRLGVALVTRNRADQAGETLCAIVWAPYQFSWTLQGSKSLHPREADAWLASQGEASDVILGDLRDFTDGATHFYNPKVVTPLWSKRARKSQMIGQHRYLRLARGESFRFLPIRSDLWI